MNKAQLFIPKKCKAGFNLRKDTYSGKLAYVIAHDGKKWRKENSWNGWIQKPGDKVFVEYGKNKDGTSNYNERIEKELGEELAPVEFDNTPTSGFVLNKKVGGYKSDWNMRQTYARVYDPRGFEFEINIVNLLYILENANCSKGKGLEGDFIYSWDGKDLVLLPCNSWEYEKATAYTGLQARNISTKDLVPGLSYKTKKEENLVYVGRHMWYTIDWYRKGKRTGKKCHIFYKEKETVVEDGIKEEVSGGFIIKNDVSFLSVKNSDEQVSNFAKIIDKFNKDIRSSDIVKWDLIPVEVSLETKEGGYYGLSLVRNQYFRMDGDLISEARIELKNVYNHNIKGYESSGYLINKGKSINPVTKEAYQEPYGISRYSDPYSSGLAKTDLLNAKCCDLIVTLENGKKIKVKSLYDI